jgi:ribosomal protein L37AE/L43A
MKEVVIQSWCDVCASENGRARADTVYRIGIDGPPHDIDLCLQHEAVVADLARPLSVTPTVTPKPGRPPKASLSSSGPGDSPSVRTACRICGKTFNKTSLTPHIWSKHRRGEVRPAPPASCPDCGATTVSPRHMGVHRAQTHGWNAIEDAYSGVPVPVLTAPRKVS